MRATERLREFERRDIHDAAIPTLAWLLLHASVVVCCVVRRPAARSGARG